MSEWWQQDARPAPAAPPPPPQPAVQWPQVTEYIEAVERGAFGPGPLQGMTVVEGGFLGGPLVLTGRSAAVFCVSDGSGQRHAMRVLMSEPSPNLSNICWVSRSPGSPLPASHWLTEGVRVGDEWWPVLLMPWVEGTALDRWVDRFRKEPDQLRRVADALLRKVVIMADMGLVHGDLQHGNVLVDSNAEVHLVDLDGLVQLDPSRSRPADGWIAPSESGHPNYQHPERTTSSVWSPSVDIFSTLVIDASIRAIALEPALMDKHYTEDNLLFVAEDLSEPSRSEVFDNLSPLDDQQVSIRCQQLQTFAEQTILGCHPHRQMLLDGQLPTGAPYRRPWYMGLPSHDVVSDWQEEWDDEVPVAEPAPTSPVTAPGSATSGTGPMSAFDLGPTTTGPNWLKALAIALIVLLVVGVFVLAVLVI